MGNPERSLLLALLAGLLPLSAWAAADAAPGLVAHWDAQAAKGNVLPDLSRHGHDGRLVGVTAMRKVEDLVERPYLAFDGVGGHVVVPHQASLNPAGLSIVVCVSVPPGSIDSQKPLLVKSLPSHRTPWYQYGLFLMDRPESPCSLSLYLSVGGRLQMVAAPGAVVYDTWQCLAGTYDGTAMRLFRDGTEVAVGTVAPPAPVDAFEQPLLLGAYGNLAKSAAYCLAGAVASVRLYDGALSGTTLRTLYETEKSAFPAAPQKAEGAVSEYARGLNEALRQGRDVWGEKLIADGGATYAGIKDYLHPLFFSTGDTYTATGVHNLVFGEDNGQPPFIIPLADGSRIAATRYDAARRLEVFVGPDGGERFGAELGRLTGPALDGGWYPVLQTGYNRCRRCPLPPGVLRRARARPAAPCRLRRFCGDASGEPGSARPGLRQDAARGGALRPGAGVGRGQGPMDRAPGSWRTGHPDPLVAGRRPAGERRGRRRLVCGRQSGLEDLLGAHPGRGGSLRGPRNGGHGRAA